MFMLRMRRVIILLMTQIHVRAVSTSVFDNDDARCNIKRRHRGIIALLTEELLAELQGITIFHSDERGLEFSWILTTVPTSC
jgi:hypothetical protein